MMYKVICGDVIGHFHSLDAAVVCAIDTQNEGRHCDIRIKNGTENGLILAAIYTDGSYYVFNTSLKHIVLKALHDAIITCADKDRE